MKGGDAVALCEANDIVAKLLDRASDIVARVGVGARLKPDGELPVLGVGTWERQLVSVGVNMTSLKRREGGSRTCDDDLDQHLSRSGLRTLNILDLDCDFLGDDGLLHRGVASKVRCSAFYFQGAQLRCVSTTKIIYCAADLVAMCYSDAVRTFFFYFYFLYSETHIGPYLSADDDLIVRQETQ